MLSRYGSTMSPRFRSQIHRHFTDWFQVDYNGEKAFLYYQCWIPADCEVRANIFLLHHIHGHSGRYERLVQNMTMSGYAVFSYDYYGHGRSDGKSGYIDDVAKWADHAEAFIKHIRDGAPVQPLPTKFGKEQEKEKQRRASIPIKNDNMRESMESVTGKPWIIHGDALGGAFGLIISTRLTDFNILGLTLTGVFVLLPSDTHALLQKVAGVASQLMPTSPVASVDLYKRCHSEAEIQQYIDDPLTRKGNIRARVGYGIMVLSKTVVELLPSVTVPFITLHGSEDWYCDVDGAKLLHEKAKSQDKTIHVFDGFYHDLLHELCSESMINELMIWINKRAPQ